MRRPLITSWRSLWEHRLQIWLARHNSWSTCRHRKRRRRADSLLVEGFEARTMLSAVAAGVDATGQDMLNEDATPTISFPDFSNPSGLTLLGNATAPAVNSNVLRLTNAFSFQAGAAWYTAQKPLVSVDWETTFDFNLNQNRSASGGGSDGFAFVIQNHSPNYLLGGSGLLGYHDLPNSLAVEFDTFQNNYLGDPSDSRSDPSHSHISVHTGGTGPNAVWETFSLGSFNTPAIMDNAATHTARIGYTPGTLSVYLDNLTSPVLTVQVDLGRLLDLDVGRAWVGFAASTSGDWQNHDILNWDYRVLADTSTTVTINDVSLNEGDAGTTDFIFTVTRSGDTTGTTTVDWATADGTATVADDDYLAASGQVTFAPGETEQAIAISVNRDVVIERDETFFVNLSSTSGGSAVDGRGMGTIVNDDGPTVVVDSFVKIAHETNGGPTLADGDWFGRRVASLGDLDGNGIEDLVLHFIIPCREFMLLVCG